MSIGVVWGNTFASTRSAFPTSKVLGGTERGEREDGTERVPVWVYVGVEGEGGGREERVEARCRTRKHASILRGCSNETRSSRIQESASVSMGGVPGKGGDEQRCEGSR